MYVFIFALCCPLGAGRMLKMETSLSTKAFIIPYHVSAAWQNAGMHNDEYSSNTLSYRSLCLAEKTKSVSLWFRYSLGSDKHSQLLHIQIIPLQHCLIPHARVSDAIAVVCYPVT